jgi:hypothetical protein
MIKALFFDDNSENFKDKHKCPGVQIVRSRIGRQMALSDAFLKSPAAKDLKGSEDMLHRDAGLSEATFRKYDRILDDSPHIRVAFMDFDLTLTTWNGLFDQMDQLIAKWRRKACWTTVRNNLFESESRAKTVTLFLHKLLKQDRVMIVTNQDDGVAIRHMLAALAQDFLGSKNALRDLPVYGLKERGGITKFDFFLEVLGSKECKR